MSKRQRFFVELLQDQVTMVSWKQLVADAEQISTSEKTAPSTAFPAKTGVAGLNRATIPDNSNTTESNRLKSRGKLKLSLSNSAKTATTNSKPAEQKPSLDERTLITYTSRVHKLATQTQPKPNEKRIVEAKLEFGHEHDSVAAMKWERPTGKVHRSMPGKTSCRTKRKTQACFCCSKKDPETQT